MARKKLAVVLNSVREIVGRSRKAVVGLAGLVLIEVGGRIALPGVNTQVLADYFLNRGGGLLSLFDRFVGGALTRGAVLALGIMPYLSARIFVRLARVAFPSIGAMEADEVGRTKLRRGTRVLTVGLSLVQSYGFARFVQAIPGAVVRPGAGFVVQTMLTLTAGAIVAMALAEQFIGRTQDTDDVPVLEAEQETHKKDAPIERLAPSEGVPLLQPGGLDTVPEFGTQRETLNIPR
jgi:preprotein translocase subunit SecY